MDAAVRDLLLKCGIENAGVCGFASLREWLINCKARTRIPQNAQSVIMAVFPYYIGQTVNISKYAAVQDYHEVVTAYLEKAVFALKARYPRNEFAVFCDNSPVPEVYAAAAAGLGVIGENGLLITKKYGSYVFIGEIITDLTLTQSGTGGIKSCIKCGGCEQSCFARALGNKKKCVSAVSQKKGSLDNFERELLIKAGTVWGCDICQDVCPMNKDIEKSGIAEFIDSFVPRYTEGADPRRAWQWREPETIKRNITYLESKELFGRGE